VSFRDSWRILSVGQKLDFIKGDFRNYLGLIWSHLGLPRPTPIQDEIGEFLMDPSPRKIILAFRGVGKSWLTSAYVSWRLLQDPQLKFLVVSASRDRANDFSTFVLRLIREVPLLKHLQPTLDQRASMLSFDVGPASPSHSPSVKSRGIFGTITGSRANEIIADDVEVPNNALTPDLREKLLVRVKEFEGILLPGGKTTFLGTPQTEESLYNKLGESGDQDHRFSVRYWPSQVPQGKIEIYRGGLAPSILEAVSKGKLGIPTDPGRFNGEVLDERRAFWGKAGYSLQFMLDTSLSDQERYPLKLGDLLVMGLDSKKAPQSLVWAGGKDTEIPGIPLCGFTGDRWHKPMWVDPEWASYTGSVMAIDPSGRGKDETGWAVVKNLHGFLFLVDAGGETGGYSEDTLRKLGEIAKRYEVSQIIVEENFGDGMYAAMLRPVLKAVWPGCSVDEVRHSTQKELRIIDTLEPIMSRHRLVVDEGLCRRDTRIPEKSEDVYYGLFYQMSRITRSRGALKHDDRLDALAIAVNFWVEFLGVDLKDAKKQTREARLQREQRAFRGVVLGKTRQDQPVWV
jgi:hypothetical protein